MKNIKLNNPNYEFLYEELDENHPLYRNTKHMATILSTICTQLGVAVPSWIVRQIGQYGDINSGFE